MCEASWLRSPELTPTLNDCKPRYCEYLIVRPQPSCLQIETLKPVYEEAKEALSKWKGSGEALTEEPDSSDF